MTILYALGWTQHSIGSQMIRSAAMVQLLLGNIGMPGGGMNALRGHSNIQGLTDLGLLSNLLPGYLTLPSETRAGLRDATSQTRTLKPLRPNQMSYWQNYPQVPRQPDEGLVRRRCHAPRTTGATTGCPSSTSRYDILQVFELMDQGKVNGYICQGFNPLAAVAGQEPKMTAALAKLKCLVVMDPLATETSEFWQNFGAVQRRRIRPRSRPKCSACRPPASPKRTARWSTRGRWLQWHWKGADAAGRSAHRHRDHGRAVHCACASFTRAKAARSPIRS